MPQPDRESSQIPDDDMWNVYDLHVDRTLVIGELNEQGWWNFDRIQLFQEDFNP